MSIVHNRKGLEDYNNLSENHSGFKKGISTVNAIQALVDIATKLRRKTDKRKGFFVLISIDICV